MLEVKKDRIIEINKQLKKAYKSNYAINIKPLLVEKKDLLIQIQKIEMLRGDKVGR